MKKIALSGVIMSLVASLGCGGGNDEAVALSSPCDPNPVSVGQEVSCLVGKAQDSLADCTFFIEKRSGGTRIPVEARLSSADQDQTTVDFEMPFAPAGSATLVVGCGEAFDDLAGLKVVAPEGPVDDENSSIVPQESGTVPTSNAGDEIVPVVPAPAAAPVIEAPTPASPPAVAPAPFQVALEGSLLPSPSRLGAAHLSARITGGGALREAYFYGVFDGTGACDHVLAIDPSGNPLYPGSRNYETYSGFVGERCVEAENNCEGFREINADGTPAPVHCRVDLNVNLTVTDFYFRLSQLESRAHLVARSEDGTLRADDVVLRAPRASLTHASIVISETQPEFTVSYSYGNAGGTPTVTGCRALAASANSGLLSGSASQRCALDNGATVSISVPGIGSENSVREVYKIECADPQVVLKKMGFTAANGSICPVTESGWNLDCDKRGAFDLQGEAFRTCDISKQRVDGGFDVVATQSVPWVNQVKLTESQPGGDCPTVNDAWVTVTPDMVRTGRAVIRKRLQRTHACQHYVFSARGENGRERSLEEAAPFQAEFQIVAGTSYQYVQPASAGGICPANFVFLSRTFIAGPFCEAGGAEGLCVDPRPSQGAAFKISWRGKHLKRVQYHCTASGAGVDPERLRGVTVTRNGQRIEIPTSVRNVTTLQPDPSSYDDYTAVDGFKIHDEIMGATIRCELTGITYDDREIRQVAEWNSGC